MTINFPDDTSQDYVAPNGVVYNMKTTAGAATLVLRMLKSSVPTLLSILQKVPRFDMNAWNSVHYVEDEDLPDTYVASGARIAGEQKHRNLKAHPAR